jgi:D-tyrosyl-tRNA(Tyr) deacylase
MIALIQRVNSAQVKISQKPIASITKGLLIYLGIKDTDTPQVCDRLIAKLLRFRFFSRGGEKFDLSLADSKFPVLVVSQFTLYGDLSRGTSPSFTKAMPPKEARQMYDLFLSKLKATGTAVESGEFGAYMEVESNNDGPVNFLLEY